MWLGFEPNFDVATNLYTRKNSDDLRTSFLILHKPIHLKRLMAIIHL